MQEPPLKGCGGCSQGRLQEAEVPDARPPSVSLDLVRVERDHLVERQEDDLHESASRLKTPPYCRTSQVLFEVAGRRGERGPDRLLLEYARTEEDRAMNISIAHLHAIVAIVIGILILVVPRLLSYLVAIYLILTGLIGLGFALHLPR